MAKLSKRRRRRWRRHLRTVLLALLLLGGLPGLLIAAASGEPGLLWLIPVGMLAALVGAPFAVLGLVMMALPVLTVGLVLGVPALLAYRAMGGRSREEPGASPEVHLRRRYVAGELSYAEFRDAMLERLKERYARGELRLTEYEAEVERLLRPGRHLDAGRDPALAEPLRLD